MQVQIVLLEKKFARERQNIARDARFFMRALHVPDEVEVFLLGDRFWKRHAGEFKRTKRGRHMARDGFNVLSYPAGSFPRPKHEKKSLGVIYLDLDYIKRHGEDVAFMLLHGILHLLGYGHVRKNDRIKMERQERRLLRMFRTKLRS